MKSITYTSKVVTSHSGAMIPIGFSEIVRLSKNKNASIGVTGVLSYRNGHYIQVIEGEDRAVDSLFSTIQSDKRHTQVTVLIDAEITDWSFPGWDMKLLQSVHKDKKFQLYVDKHLGTLKSLNQPQKNAFNIFYKLDQHSARHIKNYNGKNLKLKAWPDFLSIKASPVIIELCSRLTKKSYRYNKLLDSGHFGTQMQLDKILNKFDSLGILIVADEADQVAVQHQLKPSAGFYFKMKHFLGRR